MNLPQGLLPVILAVLLIVVFAGLVYSVFLLLPPKSDKTWIDIIQTIAAVGIFLIALYGVKQYEILRAEKRPYVTLMNVTVESNLTKDNVLIRFPEYDENNEKLKPLYKQLENLWGAKITAVEMGRQPGIIRDMVEEILFDLHFKNSGPIGAIGCEIRFFLFSEYNGEKLKVLWTNEEKIDQSKSENLKSIKNLTWESDLMPAQEQVFGYLFHGSVLKQGNMVYLLCEIKYDSIRNKSRIDKARKSNIDKKKEYHNFALYRIWYVPAHTDIYYASLINSESHDFD